MKASSLVFYSTIVFFLSISNVFSQENEPDIYVAEDQIEICLEDSSFSSLFIDAGCLVLPVKDFPLKGISIQLGGTSGHLASGLSLDFISSDKVFFPSDFNVPDPSYKYFSIGWDNEYICNLGKRIQLSFRTKAGFGYAEYSNITSSSEIAYYEINDTSSYYTPVYSHYSGLIASEMFFLIEPGMKVSSRITSWLSIGAGWSSRIVFGINEESPLDNDSFYSGNLFLRFKVPGSRVRSKQAE